MSFICYVILNGEEKIVKTYIAVDIGASSGRLMKSRLEDGQLTLDEIHRFKNGYYQEGDLRYWDIDQLIQEILKGLQKLKKSGVESCQIGIDTWGVDYCLIGEDGQRLSQPISYRDSRTNHAVEKLSKWVPLDDLYKKTGIQIQPFNTLFQLFVEDKKLLKATKKILLIPDYIGYVLTGKAVLERTNASTTQLLNIQTGELDPELLNLIGLSSHQFPDIVEAGTRLGELNRNRFPEFDLPEATIITVASHDTASAIVGTPAVDEDWAFISSGTWSLLGTELAQPVVNSQALKSNYSNEAGAFATTRFLKNIMGLWLIQEVSRLKDNQYTFKELARLAEQESGKFNIPLLDVNDNDFLNPENMIEAIQSYCQRNRLTVPITTAQLAITIYHNLAVCYKKELANLEALTRPIKKLHIVGGGSNANILNQLTADETGVEIEAGPSEATAIGNIIMQMLTTGELDNLENARKLIRYSFEMKTFYPKREE